MRPLTKKAIEAGLVDRHVTRLLERWGMSDPREQDTSQEVRVASREALLQFADEVDSLIESERGQIRESRLQILAGDPIRVEMDVDKQSLVVFQTQEGYFMFPLVPKYAPGSRFCIPKKNHQVWTILSSTPLFLDHVAYAVEVQAEIDE